MVDKEDAWNFVVARYAEPGRATQLLALQDEQGLDIVLDLFRAYAASRFGRTFDAQELADAASAVARWRDKVILPLRAVRRALKHGGHFASIQQASVQELRSRVAQAELAAERGELDALCDWLASQF